MVMEGMSKWMIIPFLCLRTGLSILGINWSCAEYVGLLIGDSLVRRSERLLRFSLGVVGAGPLILRSELRFGLFDPWNEQ